MSLPVEPARLSVTEAFYILEKIAASIDTLPPSENDLSNAIVAEYMRKAITTLQKAITP